MTEAKQVYVPPDCFLRLKPWQAMKDVLYHVFVDSLV